MTDAAIAERHPDQARLRRGIIGLAIVAGLLASFVVGYQVAGTRQIKNESAPAIVNARQVQASLAEANAAAAVAFLAGGVENLAQRQIYEESLAAAAIELESAARLVGDDDEAHQALADMTAALPRYAGLIEAARANNRQGFPVGAAYLSSATALLEDEVYPDTDLVANRAAARYRDAYDRQRGLGLVLGRVVTATALVLGGVLVVAQAQLRRRFNRVMNGPMILATVLTLILAGWLGIGFATHSSHLAEARTDGYTGTRLLLDLRSNGFGAKADEAQFLIARGAGESFEASFDDRAARVKELQTEVRRRDLVRADEWHRANPPTGDPWYRRLNVVERASGGWRGYVWSHSDVTTAERAGDRDLAVSTALDQSVVHLNLFDEATGEILDVYQARFDDEMVAAERALRGLQYGSLVVCLAIAALAAYGLQLRINEYR